MFEGVDLKAFRKVDGVVKVVVVKVVVVKVVEMGKVGGFVAERGRLEEMAVITVGTRLLKTLLKGLTPVLPRCPS